MKKPRFRALKITFWVCVALAAGWVAFAPTHAPKHHVPREVEVERPPEPSPLGDEQSVPSPKPEAMAPVEPPPSHPQSPQAAAPMPQPPAVGSPKIAIVIDDVGLDVVGSRRAVALPPYVTLSYMPYASRLHEQTREAQEIGHELMLHMPMEPIGHADPGPGALLVGLPPDEIRQRFDTALASFTGFDGVNNHMGSKFTADAAGMKIVAEELQPRHLFFLDSRTSPQSVAASVAREQGVPTITRDVFLDDDMSPQAVRTQLEQTERVARHKGYAVAIGHPHAATLQELEAWLPEAQRRGFVFVPIKELVNRQAP